MWVQVRSKMTNKVIFIPVTSLPIQFSMKTKFLKASIYIAKMTTKKADKYMSEGRKLGPLAGLLARLFTSCQLSNLPRKFTEKYFAVFNQSSCTIYLTWYWSLLFFAEFSSIIAFVV